MDDQPGVNAQRRRAAAEIEQIAATFARSGLPGASIPGL
jgi:hypothetical protein